MSGLLILAPLGIEEAAVRGAGRVLRTGMGPQRARIAAARALAIDADAVAVAGLCGGVVREIGPGDIVCATELRLEDGTVIAVPEGEALAAALRRHSLPVHAGAILSAGRVLRPAERSALEGILAVDMESAWLAAAAGGRPFGVVRVVVDAAGRRLADPRIAVEALRALRTLRRTGPALSEWARAPGPRNVVPVAPTLESVKELVS